MLGRLEDPVGEVRLAAAARLRGCLHLVPPPAGPADRSCLTLPGVVHGALGCMGRLPGAAAAGDEALGGLLEALLREAAVLDPQGFREALDAACAGEPSGSNNSSSSSTRGVDPEMLAGLVDHVEVLCVLDVSSRGSG